MYMKWSHCSLEIHYNVTCPWHLNNLDKRMYCLAGYRLGISLAFYCLLWVLSLLWLCSYLLPESRQWRIFPHGLNSWLILTVTSGSRFKGLRWLDQSHLDNPTLFKSCHICPIIYPSHRGQIHHISCHGTDASDTRQWPKILRNTFKPGASYLDYYWNLFG